jgi:ubiquitin C-terminal hydrolase
MNSCDYCLTDTTSTIKCNNCNLQFCKNCLVESNFNCLKCNPIDFKENKNKNNEKTKIEFDIDDEEDNNSENDNSEIENVKTKFTIEELEDLLEYDVLKPNEESEIKLKSEVESELKIDVETKLSISEKIKEKIPIRCPNLGNTCYINSVLQQFFQCSRLYAELREVVEIKNESDVVELIMKVREMYVKEKKINIFEQCDSYLFLSFLLDKINEVFPSKFNPYFCILLHSKLKCVSCKNIVHSRQCENILYLRPTEESKSIKEMMKIEHTEKNLNYKCNKCGHEISNKKTKIDNLPEYLFITLQQFGEENISFEIESELDINGIDYELCGMIEHLGVSTSSGHYISYILNSDKEWILYDDSRYNKCNSIDKVILQNNRIYSQVLVVIYKIYRE